MNAKKIWRHDWGCGIEWEEPVVSGGTHRKGVSS